MNAEYRLDSLVRLSIRIRRRGGDQGMERTFWRSELQATVEKRTANRNLGTAHREAFTELYRQHGEALIRYCRFLTGSALEAEDLLQEAWVKAWSSFREGGRVWNRTYLRRIAYHTWVDRVRRAKLEAAVDKQTEHQVSDIIDPLQLWSAAERIVRVLTPDQRTAYLLMEYMRFTAAETAQLMKTTEGGVKASLHRARKKLDGYRESQHVPSEKSEHTESVQDEQKIYAYMQAIQLQDVRALLILWNGGSGEDAALAVRCTAAVRPSASPAALPSQQEPTSIFRRQKAASFSDAHNLLQVA
ncbi:hypothetical protein B9G55_16310 [Saccharibacillus sp. O16]|nr:hypothetical protein B9G55_16310 [Saccharibacillus sp. O16]